MLRSSWAICLGGIHITGGPQSAKDVSPQGAQIASDMGVRGPTCISRGAHITPTLVLTKLHLEIREPAAHIINPRHMREGYGSHSVCPSICLSVTALAATYLIYTLKTRSCGFLQKRFVQKLWRHFLTISAFFAS